MTQAKQTKKEPPLTHIISCNGVTTLNAYDSIAWALQQVPGEVWVGNLVTTFEGAGMGNRWAHLQGGGSWSGQQ